MKVYFDTISVCSMVDTGRELFPGSGRTQNNMNVRLLLGHGQCNIYNGEAPLTTEVDHKQKYTLKFEDELLPTCFTGMYQNKRVGMLDFVCHCVPE